MHRRDFIVSLGSAALLGPTLAFAQTGAPSLHVALMNPGGLLPLDHMYAKLLLPALEKRGYVLGQKLALELPGAGPGAHPKLGELLEQLKAKKINAVVTLGYPTAVAAKASGLATVVAGGAGDPVATGLVDSLAHPGGNVTGISDDATTLSTKRLELLKEMSPQLRRVAMLWNKDDLAHVVALRGVGKGRAKPGRYGAAAWRARTGRFQRCLRGDEQGPAGCNPDGVGLADAAQSQTCVRFRGGTADCRRSTKPSTSRATAA